ncbi:MAG: amine dehydrogenase large subunit [Pseudomonadales bacterium]|jgi:methylamine dehydrogenase heavy chain|nr:amine dehydrogenase large subunit [Pseudomonadales bacterium]
MKPNNISVTGILICSVITALWPGESVADFQAETPGLSKLETPSPNWVWIGGAGSSVTLMDIENDRYLAQFNNGVSTLKLAIPTLKNEFYSLETYMTRMYRGARTDVVTVRSKDTLAVIDEVEIPAKSYEGMSLVHTAALTDDDRFLLGFNMTPGQSVSVVDMQSRRFIAELDTTGCALVYPTLQRRFHLLCGDGSVATLQLDESGQLVTRARTAPFFDPDGDPVMEKGARHGNDWYFTSFHGLIYKVAVVNSQTRVASPWSLVTERERNEQWKPGGMVPLAVHDMDSSLYVLMHRGGFDTHKQAGTEAWVFDLDGNTRKKVIRLKHPAQSLHLTQGKTPYLLALSEEADRVDVYHADTGEWSHVIEAFGDMYPALFHNYLQ